MKRSLVAITVAFGMLLAGALFQDVGATSHTILDIHRVEVTAICSRVNDGAGATGLTQHEVHLTARRMAVFKKILRGNQRFLVFYSTSSPGGPVIAAREAAEKLGIELTERSVKTAGQLKTALNQLKAGAVDGIFHIPDAWVDRQADRVFRAAREKKIPTMTFGENYVTRGALASYGARSYRCALRAGAPTNKLLAAAAPQDFPARQIERFHLAINLETAREIGFTFPPKILKRADNIVGGLAD